MLLKKKILIGLTREELESFAVEQGEPKFRGRQLYTWIYQKRATSFDQMTDLPAAWRLKLPELAEVGGLELARPVKLTQDRSQKFLFTLADGLRVESVYLPDSPGETVCISSQVGCALGCQFCATAKMGLFRNLTVGEIVGQVLEVERRAETKLTNVVFMGMGEPLHNYENVVAAVRLLADPNGVGLSARRITVSTVGLVPGIERWMQDDPPAKLAISLHATTDERRAQIMPVNKAYPLDMLFKSLRRFAHYTRDHVTFEYIMIADFNDRGQDVDNLEDWLKNIPAKVNLIRLHPTGSGLKPSSDAAIDRFMGWLTDAGIRCTLRESRGVEDEAACGMLFTQEPFKPNKAKAWEKDTE
ncbi:MAG: 23S rRNA (adenine(2503)-C(2))-methyltransferase RlmN [bacterium]|nr:23S rRNA (adenine(2503)-C(2))-methyltransferase RlmN [bacterium]